MKSAKPFSSGSWIFPTQIWKPKNWITTYNIAFDNGMKLGPFTLRQITRSMASENVVPRKIC